MANNLIASKHHAAGNVDLVGIVSATRFGPVVHDQISFANDLAYPDFHCDVDARVFSFSGKRRHCLPAKDADPGLSVHVHRCGLADLPREKAGQKAASAAAGRSDR